MQSSHGKRLDKDPHCSFCGINKEHTHFMIVSDLCDAKLCLGCACTAVMQAAQSAAALQEKMLKALEDPVAFVRRYSTAAEEAKQEAINEAQDEKKIVVAS